MNQILLFVLIVSDVMSARTKHFANFRNCCWQVLINERTIRKNNSRTDIFNTTHSMSYCEMVGCVEGVWDWSYETGAHKNWQMVLTYVSTVKKARTCRCFRWWMVQQLHRMITTFIWSYRLGNALHKRCCQAISNNRRTGWLIFYQHLECGSNLRQQGGRKSTLVMNF